jgi:hypothetical protein
LDRKPTRKRIADVPSPKELLTRLNRKLSPPPEQPQFEYAPWSEPDPDNIPSSGEQRRAGAVALSELPQYQTQYLTDSEVRAEQQRRLFGDS